MRIAVIAMLLALVAILVLGVNDVLNQWGFNSLLAGPLVLLLCIPLSMALFTFLSHRQDEQRQAEKQKQQESKAR